MADSALDFTREVPCSVLLILSFATSLTAGQCQFAVNVIQPTPVYSGNCDYNYDAVKGEPLTFTIEANVSAQTSYTLLVRRPNEFVPLPGCQTSDCNYMDTCVANCTVSSKVSSVPDAGPYAVVASAYDVPLCGDDSHSFCVTVQDRSQVQVSFVTAPDSLVVSGGSSVQLTYTAEGYPKPLAYELSCGGKDTMTNDSGQFWLTNLAVGVTNCTALAYTSRKLARTAALPVSIIVAAAGGAADRIGRSSLAPSIDAPLSSPAATHTTAPVLVPPPSVGASQDALSDQAPTIVISVTVIGVLLAVVAAAVLVAVFARRKRQHHNLDAPAMPTALLPPGPHAPQATTIINNTNSYAYNYNGPVIEVNGPGSTVNMVDSGGHDSSAVHARGGSGSRGPQPTVHRYRHGQADHIIYEYPAPIDPAALPVVVEVDGEETAVKRCYTHPIAQG